MDKFLEKIKNNQDLKYRDFHAKLIPNIDKELVIGVRVPVMRKITKEILSEDNKEDVKIFLNELPHKYFEENNLHAFIIESENKDIDKLLSNLDNFLPYVDNWATCDCLSPKLFKKYPNKVYKQLLKWLCSSDEYAVRFAIVSLMRFYLDENFKMEIIDLIVSVKREEYYIKMAIAWYMSFALIKQYDSVIGVFKDCNLDKWVHNKSIQKAVESFRIDKQTKEYLKSLKIK